MNDRKPVASTVSFFFSIFMLVIYLLLAIAILVFQWPADLPKTNRLILASAIFLYIAYRSYRMIKKKQEEKQHND